jgi:UDP:flavonoid glycosyltransferase YjiC (YdhE family)
VLIAIIATGSRGDVEPYVALGKGLAKAGLGVRLVTHEDFRGLVGAHGLEFWPVEVGVQAVAQSEAMRERLAEGNFFAVMALMAKEAKRGAVSLARASLEACREADLVVAGIGGLFTGCAVAEKLRLPFLQAHYIPFSPTSAYPSFIVSRTLPGLFGGALNRLSFHLARQTMWQGFRAADGLARRDVLDLPPAPFWGPFNSACTRGYPVLYGFSAAVVPPAPDWGANTHVTGYWFLDPEEDWSPPPALASFLEAGPPPVYVGFGSMSSRKPEETADLVLSALARTGQRGVVLSGWGGMQKTGLPSSVFMVDSVPFAWLFPRMAAVVHHGGAGTTAAGLRAGVPSVVIPFFADQPFWGRRVAALGVGPAPIPRQKLSAPGLANAITRAVSDSTMRGRAAELGVRIRAEDGVAAAVTVVRRLAKRNPA